MNNSSSRDRIPNIGIQICVITDKVRKCCHSIPLQHLSRVILIYLLMNCMLQINNFTKKKSTPVSDQTILIGLKFDSNKYF